MKQHIHRSAAAIATLCIATFFISTVLVELFGSHESIALIKHLIVIPGLFILIPAMAMTGATGFALAKNSKGRLVGNKKKRMPFIGANGLLILLPAAICLDSWAVAGDFGNAFYIVQGLELCAGAVNLTLMGLNMRDGRRMTGKLRAKRGS